MCILELANIMYLFMYLLMWFFIRKNGGFYTNRTLDGSVGFIFFDLIEKLIFRLTQSEKDIKLLLQLQSYPTEAF